MAVNSGLRVPVYIQVLLLMTLWRRLIILM